ncbi:homoserine dehydrogenase [Planoprotostelium fungivorum]|uniref:Homoserine dehydrogenase n=1 Tax=Planoprotostelium fungivorum TaxID=1890364 RepID=A0A2P6NTG2_9EUKA|nr:homoserine dehydrogenase [Planoprotostelium fungivorum]
MFRLSSPTVPRETVIRCALVGVGSVGQSLLRIIKQRAQVLREKHNIRYLFVLVSDSSGTLVSHHGLDVERILALKTGTGFDSENFDDFDTTSKHPLSTYKVSLSRDKKANVSDRDLSQIWFYPAGTSQTTAEIFLNDQILPAETFRNNFILFEATPVNHDGEPGLSTVKNAMERGAHIVLANKGPIAVGFRELQQKAKAKRVNLLYGATVCGGLPVLNIGRYDLSMAQFTEIRGVFNSTSNFILCEMGAGRTYEAALKEAQRRGIAETDPTLDVNGSDTASKLYILFSTVISSHLSLSDVEKEGITEITKEKIEEAKAAGKVYKLVASAVKRDNQGGEEKREEEGDKWELCVKVELLPKDDFLALCDGWQMGVEFHSDLFGSMYHKVDEREPTPTAAAMLRDALTICGNNNFSRRD